MAKKKTAADVGKLADAAQASLNFLADEGYSDEVETVRAFLVAQGEYFIETQKISREMLADLNRQLSARK